jgi:pimeloyl-ACP methyl ester carboxylesterase
MSTYVLIHGGGAGGWVWDRVTPHLERNGHKVVAPDLPSHGNDETPIQWVTLQAYADRICEVLEAQTAPVVLVGHSSGGIAITQAAEYCPDRIEMLVYLSAYLLPNGMSLLQYVTRDTELSIGSLLIIAEDQSYVTLREEGLKAVIFGDCSDEDMERFKSLMVPEATAPVSTPLTTTDENFGRVPRVYIECLQDRAIAPSVQKEMYIHIRCERVISMNTSHMPLFSAPEELAGHLSSLSL